MRRCNSLVVVAVVVVVPLARKLKKDVNHLERDASSQATKLS